MGFLDRILNFFKPNNRKQPSVDFNRYREELARENLHSLSDLEELLRPLIREATIIVLNDKSTPEGNTQLISHFGGMPYFEKGEQWPKTMSGRDMEFIFQLINDGDNHLPENIKLVQLFYDFEEYPWQTSDDGWLVKVYETISPELMTEISPPEAFETPDFCTVQFKKAQSLPDWEAIEIFDQRVMKLASVLNEADPWDLYDEVVVKLIGEHDYRSQVGGYPKWVQNESTPVDENGGLLPLLFQIDSEEKAGLMWGDSGLLYFFYDANSRRTEFELQCY
jgi:uncharacterized protein YwqG